MLLNSVSKYDLIFGIVDQLMVDMSRTRSIIPVRQVVIESLQYLFGVPAVKTPTTLWMAKIKTNSYMERLKSEFQDNWKNYWE